MEPRDTAFLADEEITDEEVEWFDTLSWYPVYATDAERAAFRERRRQNLKEVEDGQGKESGKKGQ